MNLYGLAAFGQRGVERVLELLRTELALDMDGRGRRTSPRSTRTSCAERRTKRLNRRHKLDGKTGAILEIMTLTAEDPDPHGAWPPPRVALFRCGHRAGRKADQQPVGGMCAVSISESAGSDSAAGCCVFAGGDLAPTPDSVVALRCGPHYRARRGQGRIARRWQGRGGGVTGGGRVDG